MNNTPTVRDEYTSLGYNCVLIDSILKLLSFRYFHCNFGFNTKLYDWLHDTIRLDSRDYSEDIFGGKGKEKRP